MRKHSDTTPKASMSVLPMVTFRHPRISFVNCMFILQEAKKAFAKIEARGGSFNMMLTSAGTDSQPSAGLFLDVAQFINNKTSASAKGNFTVSGTDESALAIVRLRMPQLGD